MKKILCLISATAIGINGMSFTVANNSYEYITTNKQLEKLKPNQIINLTKYDDQKLSMSERKTLEKFKIVSSSARPIVELELDKQLARLVRKVMPKLLTSNQYFFQKNVLEKYYKFLSSDLLKLTLTAKTWMEIVVLFMLNLKEDFIIKLKNGIANFHREDHSAWWNSITDNDINSFAYLIWENFPYYYDLFLNLELDNQAVKITSYSGYTYYYWDQQNPWKYNDILGERTELKNNQDNVTFQQELNTAVQERYRYDNDQCIGKDNVVEWSTRTKIKIKINKIIWEKINTLFFSNGKYDFISKLTNLLSVFPPAYNDIKYKLNLKELNSFADLIWENFSYYYNSSLKLKNNESIRITSYIGYKGGFWQRDYFEYYNEIVDNNNDIVEWKKINGRKIQNSQVRIIAKIHDEFRKKRQTTEHPDMTTPSTSGMTQSNLDEKLAKMLTMTINKSLGAEQRPSTSGTYSILNKIDNYLDETETQEDKGSNELEDSILPLIISEIDKYFESSEGEWVLLKNEINKNFDRRERIEAGLKNKIDNYFRNRGSVSASLRDKINQYFSDKEIQSKSIWKKMYKNMKKPFKTIKELISRTNQEYESMSCSQEYFRQYEEIEIEDDITPLLPVRNNFILKFIILAIIGDILGARVLKDLNLI